MFPTITFEDADRTAANTAQLMLQHQAVLIRGFESGPANRHLLRFSLQLGTPSSFSSLYPYRENGFIHIVSNQPKPFYNAEGLLFISTTAEEFLLHTDEYFSEYPAPLMLLHCEVSDPACISYLSLLPDMLACAHEAQIARWRETIYPGRRGERIALLSGSTGSEEIRFNPYEIEHFYIKTGQKPSADVIDGVRSLQTIAKSVAYSFTLQQNDCLIVNNRKALHGRSEIKSSARRIVKRIRLLADPSPIK